MTITMPVTTRSGLADYRRAWRQAIASAEAFARLPGCQAIATQLRDAAAELGATQVLIMIPCLVCGEYFPEPALVGDPHNGVPASCICEGCDEQITAEVARTHPGPTTRTD